MSSMLLLKSRPVKMQTVNGLPLIQELVCAEKQVIAAIRFAPQPHLANKPKDGLRWRWLRPRCLGTQCGASDFRMEGTFCTTGGENVVPLQTRAG